MKINFYSQNNKLKHQRNNISFEAGLTPKMMQEIQNADVLEISHRLAKKGIPTDFKDNKVIAWCCGKTVDIFEQLNKKYHIKLALPKGIFVKDFEQFNFDDLNINTNNMYGFCNLTPTKLIKNSDEITPSKVIYYNTLKQKMANAPSNIQWLYNWNNIDQIADRNYATGFRSTDIFLEHIINEFLHVIHLSNMQSKLDGTNLVKELELINSKDYIKKYQDKYSKKVSLICGYAKETPLEAVACDMSRVIANSLDKETLMPTRNPFIGTPYENLSFWQRVNLPDYSDEERPLNEILRRFWNGKFD